MAQTTADNVSPTANTIDVDDDRPGAGLEPLPTQGFLRDLPSTELLINELLRTKMPHALGDGASGLETAEACVVSCNVRYRPRDIFKVEIPSADWVNSLRVALRRRHKHLGLMVSDQKLPNLKTAVQHPRQRKYVFPPWIVAAWDQLRPIAKDWALWKRTSEWLSSLAPTPQVLATREIMAKTPWSTLLPDGSRISLLAIFASRGWVSERLLELFAKMVNEGPNAHEWLVAEPYVASSILKVERGDDKDFGRITRLASIVKVLQSGGYKELFLPANVDEGKHWVLFRIDLRAKTLEWGT